MPVLVAPLVARSWRLTWAIRSAGLVVVFGWLAVLDDRGSKIRLPEPGVLLAPVAVGLALSAACIAAAFQDDVLAGSFGWRQPLGLLSAAAVAIGVLPGIAAVGSGRWHMPDPDVDVGARPVSARTRRRATTESCGSAIRR